MKISIFGSYGEGNLGDEAILRALLSFLSSSYNSTNCVFSHTPTKSAKVHRYPHTHFQAMIATGLRSFIAQRNNGEWQRSLELLRSSDLIVIGGGGIFYEKEIAQEGFSPVTVWWLRSLIFRYLVKKPYILLGVGISSLKKNWTRFCMRKIAEGAKEIVLRDEVSLEVLRDLGYKGKAIVSTDLAWLERGKMRNEKQETRSEEGSIIGIQIRKVLGLDTEKFKNTLSVVLERLVEDLDAEIRFFPMSTKVPDDREFIKEIISNTDHQGRLKVVECSGPERVLEEFYKLDLLISTRFHGIILGIQSGLVPVVLSYSSKTDVLIQSINAKNKLLSSFAIRDFDAESLLNAVKYVLREGKSIAKDLQKYENGRGKEIRETLQKIFGPFV